MTTEEAMKNRHSVRSYKNTALSRDQKSELTAFIEECNQQGKMHIQLVADEPKAFDSMVAHYGKFFGVRNYIVLIGEKCADLEEKSGYYGEKIVLRAQQMGLNTCWVAMTFSKGTAKKFCTIHSGEKMTCVISLGYGETQGFAHKSKDMDKLCSYTGQMPDWFKNGVEASMLAPTAMNQQKFVLTGKENMVSIKNLGGFYSKIDIGIVKCHFELGVGKENFLWV